MVITSLTGFLGFSGEVRFISWNDSICEK